MDTEMPREQYHQMMEAAENYFRLLREPGHDAESVNVAEQRLNELSIPFSDDPAFCALLKLEREIRRNEIKEGIMNIRTRQITSSEQLEKIPFRTEILFIERDDKGRHLLTETGFLHLHGIQFHIPGSTVYRNRPLKDFVFEGTSVKVNVRTQWEEGTDRYKIYDIYEILKEEKDNGA